jgi:hypothetical protein
VSRILAIVMLAMLAGPASGAFTVGEAACEEDCGDFGETGDCCACLCNTRSVTVLPISIGAPATDQPVEWPVRVAVDEAPPDPEPAEILHVPKRAA